MKNVARSRIVLILFCLLVFAPTGQVFAQATCAELAEVYGATLVPIDYSLPHGWDWVIEDMERVTDIPFGNDGELELWRELPARRFWLFHFYDKEVTDEGGILGLHHLCVFTYPLGRD